MDQETVALVWSFTNDSLDIPYRITRLGKSKKDGGKGVKWQCNCPSFVHRGSKTCKHLISFRQSLKDKNILSDKRFTLTDFGMELIGV